MDVDEAHNKKEGKQWNKKLLKWYPMNIKRNRRDEMEDFDDSKEEYVSRENLEKVLIQVLFMCIPCVSDHGSPQLPIHCSYKQCFSSYY